MKKNKIFGLSLILLALTFIYIGTYAYYMNVVSGSISANTGGFVFDVLYNNATFKSIDLAKTTGDESKTFIVPGDKGKFDLVAKANGSSVNVEYTISFNSTSVPTNMKFYLDEAKTKVLDIQTNKISDYLLTSGTMEKSHTIYWEWPYDSGDDNIYDIDSQGKTFTIDVNISGKQTKNTEYAIKYIGFDNSVTYPSVIDKDEELTIDLSKYNYTSLQLKQGNNDLSLDTHYTYKNGILKLHNIIDNVTITNLTSFCQRYNEITNLGDCLIATDYSEDEATKVLSADTVTADIDVHNGAFEATAWGCDLTHDYVTINADYRS